MAQITERQVEVGTLSLHVAECGKGRPVVLLHGFPEHWYSWRHQMQALADAGYRAIAPDLRGYNLSDKPRAIADYTMDKLIGDVFGLCDALGLPEIDLVAHDWGGAVGWYVGLEHAHRLRTLTICNSPHPVIFRRLLRTPAQLRRSWYMFAFQLPFLPERQLQRPGFAQKALRGWAVHKERFPDEDLARYTTAIAQPGAATGMINYYRAALRHPRSWRGTIKVPTLVLWGEQDRALGVECLDGLERYVEDLRVVRIPDASHWVQQDAPETVNRELCAFLAAHPVDAAG